MDQTWWKCFFYRTKGQDVSIDWEIVTIISTFRNTIHHRWYHCWWKSQQGEAILLELLFSGRNCNHYLWLLTQFYLVILKNLRRQAKAMFEEYPKKGRSLDTWFKQYPNKGWIIYFQGISKNVKTFKFLEKKWASPWI